MTEKRRGKRGREAARPALKALFDRANAENAAGKPSDAEATCREILAIDDKHFGAWHLLAILALRTGDAQAALAHIERAVALAPNRADSSRRARTAGLDFVTVRSRLAVAARPRRQSLVPERTFIPAKETRRLGRRACRGKDGAGRTNRCCSTRSPARAVRRAARSRQESYHAAVALIDEGRDAEAEVFWRDPARNPNKVRVI